MQRWVLKFRYAPAVFWTIAVVLWPIPINLRLAREPEMHAVSSGEGLYKSDLTQANFGLLGVRFFESNGAVKSWAIRSEFAELHRQKENYAFMKNVDADFFSQSGNVVHTKSDYGRCHFAKHQVELEGNVMVTSQQGYRFTMKRLDYDSGTRHFRTADLVHMRGPDPEKPDMFLTGVGMDADLNQETFLIKRNTQSRRRLSTNEWIRIQSVTGEFRPQTNRAVFNDRVRAILPALTVESDRLEMNIGTDGELLRASGHVVLFHKNRRGRAERADIEVANDRVVLEGKASIESEDNELKGRRITLYTDEDRVEVEQAEGNL
jgi:LPS export ABC transporter protein LptC/lipopolysaccharide transport protein LptA